MFDIPNLILLILPFILPPGGIFAILAIILKIARNFPYKRLDYSLENLQHRFAIDNIKMLKYFYKNYVGQRLKYLNMGVEYSINNLCKEIIKKNKSGNFFILGSAGIGKSAIMRYLFLKLSKSLTFLFKSISGKIIYIPMRSIQSLKSLNEFLKKYVGFHKLKIDDYVMLFLDGLDESSIFSDIGLQLDDTSFQESIEKIKNTCKPFFHCGCLVMSARTEIFTNNLEPLKKSWNGARIQVFELIKFEKKQILDIYNNLNKLKKIEQKIAKKEKTFSGRFQNAYPDNKDAKYYRSIFEVILKDSIQDDELNSIFQYPLFIRYAYMYMNSLKQEYDPVQKITNMQQNFKIAFDNILDKAILKWDYHVFHGNSTAENKDKFDSFKKIMKNFVFDIVKESMTINDHFYFSGKIKNEIFKKNLKILNTKILKNGGNDLLEKYRDGQSIPDYILHSHCLFISSFDGKYIEFIHRSYHEYFVAEYLSQNTMEYAKILNLREKILLPKGKDKFFFPHKISDVTKYYLGFIVENKSIRQSISNFYEVLKRKEKIMIVSDFSTLTIVCLYVFFPWIKQFYFLGKFIQSETIENIIFKRNVNLVNIQWKDIGTLKRIVDVSLVESLEISGSEKYTNIKYIFELKNLKRLNILSSDLFLDSWIKNGMVVFPRGLQLLSAKISKKSSIESIRRRLKNERLHIKYFICKMDPYSPLYNDIYILHKQFLNSKVKIGVKITTELAAKERYKNDSCNNKNEIKLLESIYSLEYSLNNLAHATIYNGLSLCLCYLNYDSIDERGFAEKIYKSIKLSPEDISSEVAVQYYYRYGMHQVGKNGQNAEEFLSRVYSKLSGEQKKRCGVALLKAYIFDGKLETQETINLLNDLRGMLTDTQEIYHEFIDFYYYDMVIEITKFRKKPNSIMIRQYDYYEKENLIIIQHCLESLLNSENKILRFNMALEKSRNPSYLFNYNYFLLLFFVSVKFNNISDISFKDKFKETNNHFPLRLNYNLSDFPIKDFVKIYKFLWDKVTDPRQKQAFFSMFNGSYMLYLLFTERYEDASKIAKKILSYKDKRNEDIFQACLFVSFQAQKHNLEFDMNSLYYNSFEYMISEWKWI